MQSEKTDLDDYVINYFWVTNKHDSAVPYEEFSHGIKNIIRTARWHTGQVVLYYDSVDIDSMLRIFTTAGEQLPPNLSFVPVFDLWKDEIFGITEEEKRELFHIYKSLLMHGHCAFAKDIIQLLIKENCFFSDIGVVFDKEIFDTIKKFVENKEMLVTTQTTIDYGFPFAYRPNKNNLAPVLKKIIQLFNFGLTEEIYKEAKGSIHKKKLRKLKKEKDPIIRTIKFLGYAKRHKIYFFCPHCESMEGALGFLKIIGMNPIRVVNKSSYLLKEQERYKERTRLSEENNKHITKEMLQKDKNKLQRTNSESDIRKQALILFPRRRTSIGDVSKTKFVDIEIAKKDVESLRLKTKMP